MFLVANELFIVTSLTVLDVGTIKKTLFEKAPQPVLPSIIITSINELFFKKFNLKIANSLPKRCNEFFCSPS